MKRDGFSDLIAHDSQGNDLRANIGIECSYIYMFVTACADLVRAQASTSFGG